MYIDSRFPKPLARAARACIKNTLWCCAWQVITGLWRWRVVTRFSYRMSAPRVETRVGIVINPVNEHVFRQRDTGITRIGFFQPPQIQQYLLKNNCTGMVGDNRLPEVLDRAVTGDDAKNGLIGSASGSVLAVT